MILLVSAVREELGDLPGEPLGIGAIRAAARMSHILTTQRPEGVIFIGTGGGYPGGPSVGQVVSARRVGSSASVAVMGLGYVPRPPASYTCDPFLLRGIELPRADILTSSAVTTDEVLAGRLSDGWQVEQMEVFGVALACAEAEVPFAAVIGIASETGPEAHTQWLAHRDEAQALAREAVAAFLKL